MSHWYFVIGLGLSGQSACGFLRRRKKLVYAYDDAPKPEVTRALEEMGVVVVETFPSDVRWLVVSPGISPSHAFYQTARERGIAVIGEAELGLLALPGPAIGITGTNGKTTTTLLVAHVLREAGHQVRAVGNVGVPVTAVCDEMAAGEKAVVELSSFQLETMSQPTLDVAVILNLAPDHLDRYADFSSYCAAKRRIIGCLKPEGYLVATQTEAERQRIEFILQSSYRGLLKRERENVVAACAICQRFDIAPEAFFRYASTFSCPPHRLEFVGKSRGVSFVNDSKGTNDAAVRHAIEVTDGPITLICGGRSKGNRFSDWAFWIEGKVKHVVAIGEAASEIQNALGTVVPITLASDLSSAVTRAWDLTPKGGTVLLSPGGSSFDAYPNFKARGAGFKLAVSNLIERNRIVKSYGRPI